MYGGNWYIDERKVMKSYEITVLKWKK